MRGPFRLLTVLPVACAFQAANKAQRAPTSLNVIESISPDTLANLSPEVLAGAAASVGAAVGAASASKPGSTSKERPVVVPKESALSIPYDAAARFAYDAWRFYYRRGDFDSEEYATFKKIYEEMAIQEVKAKRMIGKIASLQTEMDNLGRSTPAPRRPTPAVAATRPSSASPRPAPVAARPSSAPRRPTPVAARPLPRRVQVSAVTRSGSAAAADPLYPYSANEDMSESFSETESQRRAALAAERERIPRHVQTTRADNRSGSAAAADPLYPYSANEDMSLNESFTEQEIQRRAALAAERERKAAEAWGRQG